MYDIFFTGTNFSLSLVFSIMVFLLTLIIFMAQLSYAGHILMCLLLIWHLSGFFGGGGTCRQMGGALIQCWSSLGLMRMEGARRCLKYHLYEFSSCPIPFSFFSLRMNSGHGKSSNQVQGTFSFVASPECYLKTITAVN